MDNVDKRMSVRLTHHTGSDVAIFLEKNFKNKSRGVNEILDKYLELRKVAMGQMKGMFSREEINAMIEAVEGVEVNNLWVGNNLLLTTVQKAALGKNWDIDTPSLIDRLKALNNFQAFFLSTWLKNVQGEDIKELL
ncbi:MAG: hypothetical protein KAW12_06990 [Candidatus Aminicenantes bacterium]|nr:hypothetical protein [Candidatus Aminicenantes bacterium]